VKLSLRKIGQGIMTALTTISVSCMAGCISNHPQDIIPVSHQVTHLPSDAHIVWCGPKTQTCFEAANTFCGSDKWNQVVESNFNYPMMIQESDRWRMVIACQ
jgi:hypothetical protein